MIRHGAALKEHTSHFLFIAWKRGARAARWELDRRLASLRDLLDAEWVCDRVDLPGISGIVIGRGPTGSFADVLRIDAYPLVRPAGTKRSRLDADPVSRLTVLPPFVSATVSRDKSEVRVWNDYAGVGRVFIAEHPDAVVVSTRIGLIQHLTGHFHSLDQDALLQFGAIGWIMGTRTPFMGIRQMDAAGEAVLRSATSRTASVTISEGSPVFHVPGDVPLEEVRSGLLQTAEMISTPRGRPLRLALSGGRDSRLLACILARAGIDFEQYTTDNYSEETMLAREIAAIVNPGRELIVERRAVAEAPDELRSSATALVRLFEGMYEPTYIGSATPIPDVLPRFAEMPTMWGAGGELAHGHYYAPVPFERLGAMDTGAALDHLLRRLGWLKTGTSPGIRLVAERLESLRLEGAEHGFEGAKIMDWFYLRERLRRWSGLGVAHEWNVAPLTSYTFARAGLSQSVRAAFESTLHRRLIVDLYPELAGFPFFKASAGAKEKLIQRPRLAVSSELVDDLLSFASESGLVARERLETATVDVQRGGSTPASEAVVKRTLWLWSIQEYSRAVADEVSRVSRLGATARSLLRGFGRRPGPSTGSSRSEKADGGR